MTGFLMFLHAVICIFLVTIILMQSGRGGGLTEGFGGGAESMFGAQTNEFMIKATTVFASLFLVTCLSLAVLSAKKDRSLMSDKAVSKVQAMKKKKEKQVSKVPINNNVPVKKTETKTQ